MILQKLITALVFYFMASSTCVNAMDDSEKKDWFYGNPVSSIAVHSIINNVAKITTVNIDHVNGGILRFYGKELDDDGVQISGVNSLGKILIFFQIHKNGKVLLFEPGLLTIKKNDDGTLNDDGTVFDVKPYCNTTEFTIMLNGNENLHNMEIALDRNAVLTTGFQSVIIKIKHNS